MDTNYICRLETMHYLGGHIKLTSRAECSSANRSEENELLRQCQEVTKVWKEHSTTSSFFRDVFRSSQVPLVDDSHPPMIATLEQTIRSLQKAKSDSNGSLWGKAKANMRAFAEFNNHKEIFSIFPSDTIYTSVLTGVVSTVMAVFCISFEDCERTRD